MKTKYKVLIALAIIAVLGLIGFLVWWFKFRNKSEYLHKRVKEYRPPVKEDVHKKITQELKTSTEQSIPKVVYLTSSYIDTINFLNNIKKAGKDLMFREIVFYFLIRKIKSLLFNFFRKISNIPCFNNFYAIFRCFIR